MTGAIIGDIIGSEYEFHNVKRKDIELFTDKSRFTDDSILTVALMDTLLQTTMTYQLNLRIYARKYGHMSVWGPRFKEWALRNDDETNKSFGNGAAMRISPVAWWYDDFDTMLVEVEKATIPSHDHIESFKGANAIAIGVWCARNKMDKKDIEKKIKKYTGYDLNYKLDDIRETNKFDATCQGSVPHAVRCFLESEDFEDAIRLAVSIGGDSDTMGAMAGSIAEAYYGTPIELWKKACLRLDNNLSGTVKDFLTEMNKRGHISKQAIECIKYDKYEIDWDIK